MIDLRFPTALQIMLSLALAEDEGAGLVSSATLAEGLGANPSFVRKLLVLLAQHDLVVSTLGKSGGVQLARPAHRVTLREVYGAALAEKKLWTARADVPHRCVVSSNIETFFNTLADDAERAVTDMLGTRTLADALAELRSLDAKKKRASARRSPR